MGFFCRIHTDLSLHSDPYPVEKAKKNFCLILIIIKTIENIAFKPYLCTNIHPVPEAL